MARQTTTPAATLEHQTAADAQVGSIGADGLEVLPQFPSREDRLSALDARDDALNGEGETRITQVTQAEALALMDAEPVTAHGVRPSEMCGVLAGSGPYAGRRCTYADHASDQPHSWEVTSEPLSEQPGHVYDDAEQQPTLPGTPEPVQTEYSVPTEASFGKAKLTPAHGLRAIGDRLIAEDDNLEHLRGIEIRYAWRRRGGTTGGNKRFARIKRPSVWEDHLTGGRVSFFVDVSADHVREFRFTDRQIEASIHEQLSRTERDDDDHDAFRINGPDFSGSISTLDKFGSWKPELRELRAHVARLPLEEAIDQADAEDDDGGEDEGE